jgi:hypothetical protein
VPTLAALIKDPSNLVPILRADAAPIGGEQCLIEAITLKDLGELCNRVRFQFLIGMLYGNDKEQENLGLALGKDLVDGNWEFLQQILIDRKFPILLELTFIRPLGNPRWWNMWDEPQI